MYEIVYLCMKTCSLSLHCRVYTERTSSANEGKAFLFAEEIKLHTRLTWNDLNFAIWKSFYFKRKLLYIFIYTGQMMIPTVWIEINI